MPPHRAPRPIASTVPAANTTDALDEALDATLEAGFTLSDSDVEILYEILRLAQDSPLFTTQPFHAIFPAYRDVLAHHDITSSNDRTYLRFLYKLEQRRAPEETLFETFETRLAQLGIELQFSSENGDGDDEPHPELQASAAEIAEETRDWRPRERRASFSSFVAFEETAKPRTRATSHGSVSRLQDHSEGFGSRMPRKDLLDRGSRSTGDGPQPMKRPERSNGPTRIRRGSKASSVSSIGHVQPKRATRTGWRQPQQQLQDTYVRPDSVMDSPRSEYGHSSVQQEGSVHLPSATQLLRDADTFDHFRMRDLTRQLLRHWKDKAIQHEWESSVIMQRADQVYAEALMRRTFDRVRDMYRLRKHLRRAEEVYTLWEARAREARDKYLLTKAFTHWEACTAEERERSAFARRHVLRVKFFNAWREITAVNKLKAQQQVLGKFFRIWKQKFVRAWIHENKAVTIYDDHLVESTYWKWFWKFCEERAPQWRDALLKRRYMQRMVEALASKKELENYVTALRGQELLYRYFGRWRHKHRDVAQQQDEAMRFRQSQIVGRALPQWQRELKLARPAQQIAQMARTRICAAALHTWVGRFKMAQHAKQLDEMRIMRNAWTMWNDRLRMEVMRNQINDRLTVQALYKWVLAEREALLKRLHNEKLVSRALETVTIRHHEVTVGLADIAEQLELLRKQRLKRSIIRKWQEQNHLRKQQNSIALQHYEPKALGSAMQLWHAKHDHQTELSRWAVEALYYVRASRTIKVWQGSVTEKKKRKMQDAYAKVRVEQKKKQASAVLQLLRGQVQHIQKLETEADTFHAQSTNALLSHLLTKWLARLEEVKMSAISAKGHRIEMLFTNAISTWQQKAQIAQQQHAQSASLATMHVEKIAYESLRKLQLRSLELQNLSAKGDTFRAWYDKRHARRLLRVWWEQTMQKRSPQTGIPSFGRTAPSRVRTAPSNLSEFGTLTGTTPRRGTPAESELATLSEITRMQDTSPPRSAPSLPGYLSTPSKRAARARIISGEALSFTPATDPRAMRRAQALLHSDIPEEDNGDSILELPRPDPEPLTRTLFHRSQGLGLEGGARSSLQTPVATRRGERLSRTGGSLIPRSTPFQGRQK